MHWLHRAVEFIGEGRSEVGGVLRKVKVILMMVNTVQMQAGECDSIKFVEDTPSHYPGRQGGEGLNSLHSKKLFSCHFAENVQVIKHKLLGTLVLGSPELQFAHQTFTETDGLRDYLTGVS